MRKKFSQELFDENDDACRNAAEYIKEDLGIDALEDNPNKYGVDLIGTLDGEFVSYVEVERKHGWKGETFPFSTVNLPARKKKYVELILPTQFVIFNHDFSYAAIIHRDDVAESPTKFISTIYTRGEKFYDIPISVVKIVKITKS
tara:strand:+ start:10723 stop:11157 length:435 start_codon:yes stop_codon:yes gene_type:complete